MGALKAEGINPSNAKLYYSNKEMSREEEEENNRITDESIISKATQKIPAKKLGLLNQLSKYLTHTDAIKGIMASVPGAVGGIADALAAITGLGTAASITQKTKETQTAQNYLGRASRNIYGGITPSGAAVNAGLLHGSAENLKGVASAAGTGLLLNDLISGDYLNNGKFSGATNTALGIANPAFGAMKLMGGFGKVGAGINGLVGVNSNALGAVGTSAAADLVAGGGAFMLINKGLNALGNKIAELDPNSNKNSKKSRFSITQPHKRFKYEDPMAAGKHARVQSMLNTMGPNGIGALTIAESMTLTALNDINYNTSPLHNILQTLEETEFNKHGSNSGNKVLNKASEEFGQFDSTGKEFDSLLNDGKPTKLTKTLLGFYDFSTQMKTLDPRGWANLFNTNDINKNAWAGRDGEMYGDKSKADKKTAQAFGISLNDLSLLTSDLDSWIGSLEDKQLGLLYYQAKIQRLSAEKLVEIAKGMGHSNVEKIGSMKDRLNTDQDLEAMEKHNFFIDTVLRSLDDNLRKLPIFKLLSPALHMSTTLAKGLTNTLDIIKSPKKAKDYFEDLYQDTKRSYLDGFIDPSLKNKEQFKNELGIKKESLTEQAMGYIAKVYPGEFKKLLSAVGVENTSKLVMDKSTNEWIEKDELNDRNNERSSKIEGLLNTIMPAEESIGGWAKQFIGDRMYGAKTEEEKKQSIKELITKEYIHVGETIDQMGDNLGIKSEDAVIKKPVNVTNTDGKESRNNMKTNWYLKEIEKNTNPKQIIAEFNKVNKNLKDLINCCKALESKRTYPNLLNPTKIFKNSVTDLANTREEKATIEEERNIRITQLPYLERIYNLLDSKLGFPINSKDQKQDQKNSDDGDLNLFGWGKNKDKKKPKTKASWASKALNYGKFAFMGIGGGAVIAAITAAITAIGLPVIIGGLITTAVGGLLYTFKEDIFKYFNKSLDTKEYVKKQKIRLNKKLKITTPREQLELLDTSVNGPADLTTKEERDYKNQLRREKAAKLNNIMIEKYGFDINSSNFEKHKDKIRNLKPNAFYRFTGDLNQLNQWEKPVNDVDKNIRSEIALHIMEMSKEVAQEVRDTVKMDDKQKEEYRKLFPKFDTVLEQFSDLKNVLTEKTNIGNDEIINGMKTISGVTLAGLNDLTQNMSAVANQANIASQKIIETSTQNLEFVLNTKIVEAIPGLRKSNKGGL